ncbi:hypothetical protein NMG60_11034216 [Bertholletia excelsa]
MKAQLDLSSVAQSSMEDTSRTRTKYRRLNAVTENHAGSRRRMKGGNDYDDEKEENDEVENEDCDAEAWATLSKGFRQVQSVLDQNRTLIQQVNENHLSKIPDNLVKNVDLIREINGNISKVMSLYSDLSVDFSNIVHQRRASREKNNITSDSNGETAGS